MADLDPRLIEYALGALDAHACAEVEHALSTSAELRAELAAVTDTLDELDSVTAPMTSPAPALRDRLFASIADATPYEGFVNRFTDMFDVAATTARTLLDHLKDVSSSDWELNNTPGVRLLHFDGGARVAHQDCGFVNLEAGVVFPTHRHGKDECALMLRGEIIEDSGIRFLPGDVVFREAGTTHGFRATDDGPAAFAVVTEIDSLDFSPTGENH